MDIVCKVCEFNSFRRALNYYFDKFEGYRIVEDFGNEVMVCNFYVDELEIGAISK